MKMFQMFTFFQKTIRKNEAAFDMRLNINSALKPFINLFCYDRLKVDIHL